MSALFKPLLKQSFASTGIYLLIFALSLAISATTALKFSNDQIQQAVSLQAAKLQAADLVLSDQYPLNEKFKQKASQLNLQQSQVTVFGSMAHTDEQFVMVNVKAIESNFPLRGELIIQPDQTAIRSGEVWLSQRALDLLNVKIGERVQIADASFTVTGVIEKDSNQELGFSAFSPTVIISQSDVAATNAIQPGSRIEYRLLMSGEPNRLNEFTAYFDQLYPKKMIEPNADDQQAMGTQSSIRLRTADEANTRLMRPIENLDTFLQLANILTILLCGIAIALTSQRYVQQNQDHVALMRCMGAAKFQILKNYIALLMIAVAIAMFIGTGLGIGLGYILLQFMLQLIPHLDIQFSLFDLVLGPLPIAIFTSVIVMFGFIVPSLMQLLNTPPIRVIREDVKSTRSLLTLLGAGAVSLILFCILLTQNIQLSLLVIGTILALCASMFSIVWLLLKMIKSLKNRWSAYVRVPNQTALQITALALGLSLITVLVVLRTDLLDRWQQQLPEGTPNQFIYGLPPYEVEQFKAQIEKEGWPSTPLYPNIRGRLIKHNGQPFSESLRAQNNSLRRELNLTQAQGYPEDNVIVSGQPQLQQVGDVSVEANLAEELGIKVGDQLSFSLPEGELQAKVVNLRTVEWESFSPNFFFIFAPNTMDENAGSYLGSFFVPQDEKSKLVNLIQQFSNTVFIDVSLILEEIKNFVSVLVQIVSILALLVSVSGFLVLIACINLLMDERKREVAILRSFGSSKSNLKNMLSLEIGFIGFMAGLVSCFFAEVISAIASYKMDLAIQPHWEIWVILPMSMMILCALIGRYRLSYLTEIPPLKSLRELNQS
ncbi:ABC transporter permease [Acinetobacter sp. Ver3]|uniref:ABC transporter permease n=1 Tax=Acinetobacter sp. Ver3 TaxID=466088 RepID=UPI00044B8E1A|nr:FtsX-like permease family protein [Acinetobacter sp. Ver3]EZQ10415.1 ABC transporter permease [Acinetobacter sp. Ver3]